MDSTIVLGVVMFTGTVLALVGVILMARSKLVSAGDVTLNIRRRVIISFARINTYVLKLYARAVLDNDFSEVSAERHCRCGIRLCDTSSGS